MQTLNWRAPTYGLNQGKISVMAQAPFQSLVIIMSVPQRWSDCCSLAMSFSVLSGLILCHWGSSCCPQMISSSPLNLVSAHPDPCHELLHILPGINTGKSQPSWSCYLPARCVGVCHTAWYQLCNTHTHTHIHGVYLHTTVCIYLGSDDTALGNPGQMFPNSKWLMGLQRKWAMMSFLPLRLSDQVCRYGRGCQTKQDMCLHASDRTVFINKPGATCQEQVPLLSTERWVHFHECLGEITEKDH